MSPITPAAVPLPEVSIDPVVSGAADEAACASGTEREDAIAELEAEIAAVQTAIAAGHFEDAPRLPELQARLEKEKLGDGKVSSIVPPHELPAAGYRYHKDMYNHQGGHRYRK